MNPLIIRLIAIAAGAVLAAVGGVVYYKSKLPPAQTAAIAPRAPAPSGPQPAPAEPSQPPGQSLAALPPTAPEPPPAAAPASPPPPQFDIVRVSPEGEAVVAGRAPANAFVELLDGNDAIARTKVDAAGQFVLLPPVLPGGDHFLALRTMPEGQAPLASTQSVTVSVRPGTSPVVTLAEPGKPSVVLAAPAPAPTSSAGASSGGASSAGSSSAGASSVTASPPAPTGAAKAGQVTIQTAEVEASGRFFATGSAAPGSTVRFYLNGTHVADAGTANDGKWSLTITKGVGGGKYALRADAVDSQGKVASRAEVPFDAPAAVASVSPAASDARPSPPPALSPLATKPADLGPATTSPSPAIPSPPTPSQATSSQGSPSQASPPQATSSQGSSSPAAPPATAAVPPLIKEADRNSAPPSASQSTAVRPIPGQGPVVASPRPDQSPVASAAAPDAIAPTANPVIPEISTATVSRGDSLWRISRLRLGKGIRYTVIYEANAQQIRDPRLIYPGQVLVMPQN